MIVKGLENTKKRIKITNLAILWMIQLLEIIFMKFKVELIVSL